MIKRELYRITRKNGKVIDTLEKPKSGKYTLRYRLIADEGKRLTNTFKIRSVIDINADELDDWREIDWAEENQNEVS